MSHCGISYVQCCFETSNERLPQILLNYANKHIPINPDSIGGKMASLKVIGMGFGQTGTDSMREALEILGFGPCHQ